MSKLVVVFAVAVVLGTALGSQGDGSSVRDECTEDSRRLTLLFSNITTHIKDQIEAETLEMASFRDNATAAQSKLGAKLSEAQEEVATKTRALERLRSRLLQSQRLLAELKTAATELTVESDELQGSCERHARAFEKAQTEHKETLRLLLLVSHMLDEKWGNNDEQLMVQELVSLLPSLAAHSKGSSQALNQLTAAAHVGGSADLGKSQLHDLITELTQDTKAEMVSGQQAATKHEAECAQGFDRLRDRAKKNEERMTDAQNIVQTIQRQIDEVSRELKLVQSDRDVLQAAHDAKATLLTSMDTAFSQRKLALAKLKDSSGGLLQQPLCCMCNDANTH